MQGLKGYLGSCGSTLGHSKQLLNSSINNQKSSIFKISLACQGNFIGAEDVINHRDYTTTVTCKSYNATLYTLKSEDFFFWFSKNDKTMEMVKNMSTNKDTKTVS